MDERIIEWTTYGHTIVHPLALTFTLVMGLLLLRLPRAYTVIPLLLVAALISMTQRVVVASLDFNMIRLLILFAWFRVLVRREFKRTPINKVDVWLCVWLAAGMLIYTIQNRNVDSLVQKAGITFDALGVYFFSRLSCRTFRDLETEIRALAWISIVIGFFMVIEWHTGRNMFAVFGGVREITWVRDGHLRCQGAFAHPIMAGTFGATLVPLFIGLWLTSPRHRRLSGVAVLAATIITFSTASSGPFLVWLAALGAWGLWQFRPYLRWIRWAVVLFLVLVHFVEKKGAWYLLARAGDYFGGTGYHRFALIDATIRNFSEWFLVGTTSTAHWGWGLQDLTNQFVYEAVTGGLLTLLCFITFLVVAFRSLGTVMRRSRRRDGAGRRSDPKMERMAWALGVVLTGHCVAFISVSYFGQIWVLFFIQLAMLASLPELARERARSRRFKTRPWDAAAMNAGVPRERTDAEGSGKASAEPRAAGLKFLTGRWTASVKDDSSPDAAE